MNKMELFEAVGGIDDRYILEAKNVSHKSHRAKIMLLAASVAVIAVLIAALAIGIASRQTPKQPDVPPAETTVKTLPYAVVPKILPPVPESTGEAGEVMSKPYLVSADTEKVIKVKTGETITHIFYMQNSYLMTDSKYSEMYGKTRQFHIDVPDGVELLTPQEFIFDPSISPFFEISFRLGDALEFGEIQINLFENVLYFVRECDYDYSANAAALGGALIESLQNPDAYQQYLGEGTPMQMYSPEGREQTNAQGEEVVRYLEVFNNYRFDKFLVTLESSDGIVLKSEKEFVWDTMLSTKCAIRFSVIDGYENGSINVTVTPNRKYAGKDETIWYYIVCSVTDEGVITQLQRVNNFENAENYPNYDTFPMNCLTDGSNDDLNRNLGNFAVQRSENSIEYYVSGYIKWYDTNGVLHPAFGVPV